MYPQYWIPSIGGCFFVLQVQRRIHIVHIFLIQLFPQELAGFTEPLEVDDLPLPEEPDGVVHIRVIAEPENVVISHPGFLLCGQIFRQVGHRVAGDGDSGGVPGTAGGGGGIDTGGVIHEIGRKAGFPNLTVAEFPGQLVDDGADHFQMPQFLSPQWSI